MMRKKISWLFLLTVFLSFCLHSCRSEDLLQDQPSNEYLKTIANGQYSSKSLWKEDEKYIRNIKKIYEENQIEIQKTNGVPYWDYATTMDHFDESFLIVPIVSGNKVVQTMQVPKVKNKVYFVLCDELQNIDFFQNLIFSKNIKKPIDDVSDVHSKLVCITRKVGMWYPADEGSSGSDGSGHWEYIHVTTCKIEAADMDQCTGLINQYGECTGEGGGYEYPGGGGGEEPEQEEGPCDKIKTKMNEAQFKQKLQSLTNPANFALDHEVGFFEKNGQFFPAASDPCNYELKANTNVLCISGIMHTHPNAGCDGGLKDKTPSPGDIAVFLNIVLPQAQSCLGNMKDAYSLTITPWGNYMLKYNSSSLPSNTTYDIDALSDIFDNQMHQLRFLY